MNRLAQLVRKTPNSYLEASTRGPKKKKGGAQEKILSDDIINIFKDRTDPEPLNIREYPTYVQQFSFGIRSIHELSYGARFNIKNLKPNQSTYKSYLRGIKRQRCKTMNIWHHIDRNPDVNDQQKDPHSRNSIYDIFVKAASDMQEKRQEQERLAAEQQDSDED